MVGAFTIGASPVQEIGAKRAIASEEDCVLETSVFIWFAKTPASWV